MPSAAENRAAMVSASALLSDALDKILAADSDIVQAKNNVTRVYYGSSDPMIIAMRGLLEEIENDYQALRRRLSAAAETVQTVGESMRG